MQATTCSISFGYTLKPDTRIMSFLRSTIFTIAALVHHADVARLEEAVGRHDLGGLVGPLPVAGHHLRAADADLARLAERHVVAVVVADRDLGRRNRQADACR